MRKNKFLEFFVWMVFFFVGEAVFGKFFKSIFLVFMRNWNWEKITFWTNGGIIFEICLVNFFVFRRNWIWEKKFFWQRDFFLGGTNFFWNFLSQFFYFQAKLKLRKNNFWNFLVGSEFFWGGDFLKFFNSFLFIYRRNWNWEKIIFWNFVGGGGYFLEIF